jgi:hypothetical protein
VSKIVFLVAQNKFYKCKEVSEICLEYSRAFWGAIEEFKRALDKEDLDLQLPITPTWFEKRGIAASPYIPQKYYKDESFVEILKKMREDLFMGTEIDRT